MNVIQSAYNNFKVFNMKSYLFKSKIWIEAIDTLIAFPICINTIFLMRRNCFEQHKVRKNCSKRLRKRKHI